MAKILFIGFDVSNLSPGTLNHAQEVITNYLYNERGVKDWKEARLLNVPDGEYELQAVVREIK